jgi:transposase
VQNSTKKNSTAGPSETELLAFNPDQLQRIHFLQMSIGGYITLREAAGKIGVSYRQAKRLKQAFVHSGARSVLHGNIGRPSRRALSNHVRMRILHLARTRYASLNDTQLTLRLQAEHGISLSRETIRRILRADGIKQNQSGRTNSADTGSTCYASEGMMVLWGGITKKWFGEHESCFMAAVDTATLRCLAARFFPAQTTEGYLWLIREVVRTCGVPQAFCQHSRSAVRRSDSSWTLEEELRGERDPSQVERALQALGIAHYLESKRRIMGITALFETFLAGQFEGRDIAELTKANQLLDPGLITAFNRSHACRPVKMEPAWKRLPEGADLERICSFFYSATVQHNNKIVLGDMVIAIPPGRQRISYAQTPVEVRQLLDGSWRVYYQNRIIAQHDPSPVRAPVPSRSSRRSSDPGNTSWIYAVLDHGSLCD